MYNVKKRDGKVVKFELGKIKDALSKAIEATEQPVDADVVDFMALKVTSDFASKVKDDIIGVEDIQDSCEAVLGKSGYQDAAKAFILYRKIHENQRNVQSTMLDYQKIVDSYLKLSDWRVKENSTVTYSVGGLILSNSGAITANYWLNQVYDKEIGDAHKNADIHIHD